MEIIQTLNPQQQEAVNLTDGPVLIVAGAGAGKTKTITYRILNLIKKGVSPESILAITFTNKAAKEMRDRVFKLLRDNGDEILFSGNPFISTFHSLGVRIIKENAESLGLPRHFGIYDKNDGRRAVKEALLACNLDPKQFEPAKIESAISRQKGNFVTAGEFADLASDYFQKTVSSVWNKYESILKREKSLDFDDLLLKTAKLLMENKEVLSRYQELWKYVHIDEYQDTNKVQYTIAKLISENHKNICVVGDTDQNIYSWRGADIKNILNFEKHYPGAKIIFLEENYRSTQNILAAADQVIKKNKYRIPKKIFTKNPEGDKIGLFEGYDETNEAEFISLKCKELINNGASPKEIAILYRANFQSRALEEAFLRNETPYQMLGTRFFERKEVKDVLSFLKASLNPDSVSDISRIINIPPRGMGKVTLQKIFAGKENELPAGMRKKYSDFKNILSKIKGFALKEKPSETIKFIIKETGLELTLKNGDDEDNERLENIMELVTLATKYDTFAGEEGVEKLLTDAALASDQDSLIKDQEAVKLMTVHASKGLEFDYVFISGLEQDLFPHKKHNEYTINSEESEEERRLFYVAVTRARKKLFLTYAQIRTIFGARQVNSPSEFLCDIEDNYIEKESMDGDDAPRKPLFKIEF